MKIVRRVRENWSWLRLIQVYRQLSLDEAKELKKKNMHREKKNPQRTSQLMTSWYLVHRKLHKQKPIIFNHDIHHSDHSPHFNVPIHYPTNHSPLPIHIGRHFWRPGAPALLSKCNKIEIASSFEIAGWLGAMWLCREEKKKRRF